MGFANINGIVPVGGPDGSTLQVFITAGTVDVTGSSVTVSSITSTVTVAGAVTITSGSVTVSSILSTVTVSGSVTITSGTVAVSAVSGTVTVAGAVTITSGSVSISSGTVTVSSVSGTVTVAGSVSISSGTVSVSSVVGTVTVSGSVTITSGSVTVSSVSGTVTVAGSVAISSGTVTVSSVSGTVTVAGSVSISSGTVAVSAVSGTVTVSGSVSISAGSVSISSGTVNVQNVTNTSLANTPTLTQQAAVSKTWTQAANTQTVSVALNTTDRVMAVILQPVGFSGSGGVASQAGQMQISVVGNTTGAAYTSPNNEGGPRSQIWTSSAYGSPLPMVVPVYGVSDSSVTITLQASFSSYTTFSLSMKVVIVTAPDPGVVGTVLEPSSVAGTPALPVTVAKIGGIQAASLVSGSSLVIAAGYSLRVHSVAGNFSGSGRFFINDNSGLARIHENVVAGGQTWLFDGMLFPAGTITPTLITATATSWIMTYDVIETPTIV
jgi:hypothetical protein